MIENNKKIFVFIIFFIIQTFFIFSSELSGLIEKKKWGKIGYVFSDSSHLQLKSRFAEYLKIQLIDIREGRIKYYAKYSDHAEIGFIAFDKKEKYFNLKIRNSLGRLKYIDRFYKFPVKEKKIKIGDAEVIFQEGIFYIADKFERLVFYKGKYKIKISPENIEEQKTLLYLFKTQNLLVSSKTGLFILTLENINKLFNKKKKNDLQLSNDDNVFINKQLLYFQNEYGMKIAKIGEFWYPSFSDSLNILFFKKNKSYYKYFYGRNNVPDTLLIDQEKKKYILSYNRIKGMKLFSSVSNKIKKIQLFLRFNPYKLKLWSTGLIIFKEPTDSISFRISNKIKLHDFFFENDNGSSIKYDDEFYLKGNGIKRFSIYYSGEIADVRKKFDLNKYKSKKYFGIKKIDDFIIFDNEQKFYPDPGAQFFESTLKISVPENFNCLASGFFQSKKLRFNRNELIFKSDGAKGLAIVCGDFKEFWKISSKIPLTIFCGNGFKVKKYFNKNKIKHSFNFLTKNFGKRSIKEVNILFRRWISYGGVSYNGLIIFNIVPARLSALNYYRNIPVILTNDINMGNLVHELAHQWWGGIISWKTYKDVWITEGGAQFSSLLYLESILSKKKFKKLINKIIKNTKKESISGPVIYGNRIENITENYNSYQSIIYNKSALIFLMLRELIGEKKLLRNINDIFSKYLRKSISTRKFISEIVNNEKNNNLLKKFFNKWIYSREVPDVDYQVNIKNNIAIVSFEQKKTDFVFPLKMIIKTRKGDEVRTIIIKNKKQDIIIKKKNKIKKIKIENGFSPVNINKKGSLPKRRA